MDEHDLLEQQKRVRTSVFICVECYIFRSFMTFKCSVSVLSSTPLP